METYKQALDTLRARGCRLTRQRQLVLEILLESREHLDAEALYDLVRARDGDISLATVYRTLALLKKAGLVQEHRLGQTHGHFETTPDDPHYHFTCTRCGRVIEFDAPQIFEAVKERCNRQGLQIQQIHLHLSGYCPNCCQEEGE